MVSLTRRTLPKVPVPKVSPEKFLYTCISPRSTDREIGCLGWLVHVVRAKGQLSLRKTRVNTECEKKEAAQPIVKCIDNKYFINPFY